jgi:hypothetical protein
MVSPYSGTTPIHELRNNTGEVRIALLLDVRRKEMLFDMRVVSNILIAAAGVAVRLRKIN